MIAAALVVEVAVAEAAEAVAELRCPDASDATEPALLVIALRAEAASLVILPKMLLALEFNDERLAAAPVLPAAASEVRLERVAEKADLAEVKLSAIDCSAFSAELEAEAATFEAEFDSEASDAAASDETEARELDTDEGTGTEEGGAVLDCANTGIAPRRYAARMVESCMVNFCLRIGW